MVGGNITMQNIETSSFSTLSIDDLSHITGGAGDGNGFWDRAGRVMNTVGNDAQNGAGLGAAVGGVGGAVVGGVGGAAAGGVGAIPGAAAGGVAGATTGGAVGGAVGGLWGLGRGIVNEFRR
jgi:bacteriocin-like protein